jgi:hypothetical protein
MLGFAPLEFLLQLFCFMPSPFRFLHATGSFQSLGILAQLLDTLQDLLSLICPHGSYKRCGHDAAQNGCHCKSLHGWLLYGKNLRLQIGLRVLDGH